MTIKPLPIMTFYDVQRFKQLSPQDAANWVQTKALTGKKEIVLYPALGRRHVRFLGLNRLIFPDQPRAIFRTVNYWYAVVDDNIYRIDKLFNQVEITGGGGLQSLSGNVFFATLTAGSVTFAVFVDGQKMYVYREDTGVFYTVSDPNAPANPTYVANFGDRIVVAGKNTAQFNLSVILLGGNGFDPATCFTVAGSALFAQASGIIKQFAVLNNTLYIMSDFTTTIWSNNPSQLVPAGGSSPITFPWKNSSSYNWDFGIEDPLSLDVDFHMMVWLAQNQNGLVQVMMSDGGKPIRLSTKAIDVLFQRNAVSGKLSPFLSYNADGFLYQYENTIYYRLSAGRYRDFGILDQTDSANSIEYNFDTDTWERVIEANGERNRIQKHIFFDNRHFVTVEKDSTVYEFSGQFYDNEISNPAQTNKQADDAYLRLPFRYELTTRILYQDEDYSEFITDYVQIDFMWGINTFVNTNTPFEDAVFIVDEVADSNGGPIFMVDEENSETFIIKEGTNNPNLNSDHYNKFFKPHIELYWSDNGGMTFFPADVREFSQLGVYSWRMRWYQLGPSRNRCYKLVCVSPAPIVILGAVMDVRRASGGAN